MKKRKHRQVVFLSLVFFLLVALFVEVNYLSTKRHKTRLEFIQNDTIPDSFDDVMIGYHSDVLSNYENLEKSIESFESNNVDIVLFGGNLLYDSINEEDKEKLIKKLKQIDAPLGKYAVLGEEDANRESYEILEEANFRLLTSSGSKIYNKSDEFIKIVGLDTDQISKSEDDNADIFKILMVNDAKYLEEFDNSSFNLFLAGKYLGGQFKIPFIGPINNEAKYYDKRYDIQNQKTIIISQGLGTYDKDMRFNTNPETVIIVLEKSSNES